MKIENTEKYILKETNSITITMKKTTKERFKRDKDKMNAKRRERQKQEKNSSY